ncbi:hypothetical protein SDC9_66832 [bioreactor metagenome]|uniref:Uncharacterized protein n=1 Tax=bioreactor metagenome TaxID=1076179 RepID=A0A644XVZ2_9ZZZZ
MEIVIGLITIQTGGWMFLYVGETIAPEYVNCIKTTGIQLFLKKHIPHYQVWIIVHRFGPILTMIMIQI